MNKKIVVTYEPDANEREIYREILENLAHVHYLKDEPKRDRIKLLNAADMIVALSFSPKEIDPAEIALLQHARFIQLIYAGADNIPFALIPPEIILASNAGAFARPIAEHVLALTLALAKKLISKNKMLQEGQFDRSGFNQEIRGGVCGIIGLGGNGKEIARTMQAMGMRVYGINRSGKTDMPVEFIGTVDDLQRVLEDSDVVVVTAPLTRETRDMIAEQELGRMKQNAILINVGRGDVINQRSLYEHLKAHPDFCAGIDTWWSEPAGKKAFKLDYPFFELPNIIGSPHIADHVPHSMSYATRSALENARNFLMGNRVRGVLNREDYLD
ncbi:D-3-phosphoglycerate dehydrogenase (EC [Olavius sp. associated proteobacterium Delta 1]|nr:D-3-phosphoglycerate dehydrogenase (EC [Olavius sp. associated proteobacterium Delta 1]